MSIPMRVSKVRTDLSLTHYHLNNNYKQDLEDVYNEGIVQHPLVLSFRLLTLR